MFPPYRNFPFQLTAYFKTDEKISKKNAVCPKNAFQSTFELDRAASAAGWVLPSLQINGAFYDLFNLDVTLFLNFSFECWKVVFLFIFPQTEGKWKISPENSPPT